MKEKWKTISGNNNYEISTHGRIKRIKAGRGAKVGKILNPTLDGAGYLIVSLYKNNKRNIDRVHQLTAFHFIGKRPSGYQINHKDCNKKNNRLRNLEYCTPLENTRHAIRHGLGGSGERNGMAKLTAKDVIKIRALVAKGETMKQVGKKFNISYQHVSDVSTNKRWAHI